MNTNKQQRVYNPKQTNHKNTTYTQTTTSTHNKIQKQA